MKTIVYKSNFLSINFQNKCNPTIMLSNWIRSQPVAKADSQKPPWWLFSYLSELYKWPPPPPWLYYALRMAFSVWTLSMDNTTNISNIIQASWPRTQVQQRASSKLTPDLFQKSPQIDELLQERKWQEESSVSHKILNFEQLCIVSYTYKI